MLDLNKFSDSDKSRILHTSGYARVGRGMQIGSTSNKTFRQRLDMAERGRTIASYRKSAIGAQRGSLKAQQATPESLQIQRSEGPAHSSPVAAETGKSKPPVRSNGFKEPPNRGYNPYA